MTPAAIALINLGANLLGNIFSSTKGSRIDKIQKQRLDEAIKFLEAFYGHEEDLLKKDAQRNINLVNQAGGREAAAMGYSGSSSVFSSPQVSDIYDRLNSAIKDLQANKMRSIANIKLAGVDLPIEPNWADYLGKYLKVGGNTLSNYLITDYIYNEYKDYMDNQLKSLNKNNNNTNKPITSNSKPLYNLDLLYNLSPGRNSTEGNINKYFNYNIGAPLPVLGLNSANDPLFWENYLRRSLATNFNSLPFYAR